MIVKAIPALILAAVSSATPVFADLAGPSEVPPASYKGQQYVDSRGCVFLRAGYAGQVTWVPRVTRDRKQLCGYGASGPVEVAEPAAPVAEPKPATVAAEPKAAPKAEAPARVVATPSPAPAPTVVSGPKAAAAPATTGGVVVSAPQGGEGYVLACPAANPVAERFEVLGGGSKTLCTKGDGTLVGATFPKLVSGGFAGAATGYDAYAAGGMAASAKGGAGYATIVTDKKPSTRSATLPMDTPPAGYKFAWTDDRLNPYRGKQTAEGFLAMDEVWTRTTPAELREESAIKRRPVTIIVRHANGESSKHDGYVLSSKDGEKVVRLVDGKEVAVSKSTKAEAPRKAVTTAKATVKAQPKASAKATSPVKAPAVATGYLVQVGTFGVISNAEGVVGRLQGQGLPVSRAKLKGGELTVVYAGPFASGDEAKRALTTARAMGFGDARIVK